MPGGGHIDVVGTLGVVAAAYALSRRRSGVAAVALAVSFSVKFLPLVLFPLLWKRIRVRDGVLAAAVVVLLYLPFSDGLRPPLGSLLVYAEQWRFNGPFFAWVERWMGTAGALVVAVGSGLVAAVVARVRLPREAARGLGVANGDHPVPPARRVSLVPDLAHPLPHVARRLAVGRLDPRLAWHVRSVGVGV